MTATIPDRLGFADDLSMWVTHTSPDIASKSLEKSLEKLCIWTNKWRMVVNTTNTEVICFSKSNSIPVRVTLNGKPLNQVGGKKLLGIAVDENLKFNKHVENARTKAVKTLSSIGRLLDETGGIRTELGLQLYKSLVFPILTYAYPAWSLISNTNVSLLEEVHEAALRKLSGTHGHSRNAAQKALATKGPVWKSHIICPCPQGQMLYHTGLHS